MSNVEMFKVKNWTGHQQGVFCVDIPIDAFGYKFYFENGCTRMIYRYNTKFPMTGDGPLIMSEQSWFNLFVDQHVKIHIIAEALKGTYKRIFFVKEGE